MSPCLPTPRNKRMASRQPTNQKNVRLFCNNNPNEQGHGRPDPMPSKITRVAYFLAELLHFLGFVLLFPEASPYLPIKFAGPALSSTRPSCPPTSCFHVLVRTSAPITNGVVLRVWRNRNRPYQQRVFRGNVPPCSYLS